MPQVINDGVRLHYRVEGEGPALILQHGFSDSCESWHDLGYIDALKTKYRLILPDTRGHGRSDKPHDPQAYMPLNFASDITSILDDLGVSKAYYWGYSQGGWIAFALAQYASERIRALVIGGAAGAGSAYVAQAGQDDPLIAALRKGAGELPGLWAEWIMPAIAERLRANDVAALIACRQQRLATAGYPNLDKIAAPTLLYAGADDPIHEAARQSASRIPAAQFISLPGLNHVAAFFRADLILPHVQAFLATAGGHVVAA